MSLFAENLEQKREERNISLAHLAKISKINSSTLFRWVNGSSIPESWERVERLLAGMQCTASERQNIKNLYERELMGERKWKAFSGVLELVQAISALSLGDSQDHGQEEMLQDRMCSEASLFGLEKGNRILGSRGEIIRAIGDFFSDHPEKVLFYFHRIPDKVVQMILDYGGEIEFLYGNNSSDGESVIHVLKNLIGVVAQNPYAEIYFQEEGDTLFLGVMNVLISESEVVHFADDMSYGICSDDREYVNFMRAYIENHKENDQRIYRKFQEPIGVWQSLPINEGQSIRVLEHEPGLTVGLTRELMETCIYPEVENREMIIDMLMNCIVKGRETFLNRYVSIFDKRGLDCFMEDGIFHMLPFQFYRSLTLEERKQVLRNVVELLESDESTHYYMVKEDKLDLTGVYIEEHQYREELDNDLYLKFALKGRYGSLALVNKELVSNVAEFFDWLVTSDYVYSEQETIEFMKRLSE